jgi:hypothetical protein
LDEFLEPAGEDRAGDAKALLDIFEPPHPQKQSRKISNVQRSLLEKVNALERA